MQADTGQGPNHINGYTTPGQKPPQHLLTGNRLPTQITGAMEIGGLLNVRNAAAADAHLRQQLSQSMPFNPHAAYAMSSHSAMSHHHHHQPPPQQQQQQHQMSPPGHMAYTAMNVPQHHPMMPTSYMGAHHNAPSNDHMDMSNVRPKSEPAAKAFACSTCSKGFARRSDLARHERIHSGIRPHACDYPGCGKQFIQRSALTVHARVHTGEKPHVCERCSKPFSDSSSLARHRRIHSGKRPYKCPYANCQKTFTRRTTLTRHQNHHTGTVEQAEAETNAKLQMSRPQLPPRSRNSSYSDAASGDSSASPTRHLSISPHQHISAMSNIQKAHSDYQYMQNQSQTMTPQMRNDYHAAAVAAAAARNPQVVANQAVPAYAGTPQARNGLPPQPPSYGIPRTLEPPTTGTGSGGTSPHMSGMGWVASNNGVLQNSHAMDQYMYQDASYSGQPLYYQASNIRRPQSTEPEDYGIRRGPMGHHLATGTMAMPTEWSAMPIMSHEIKQERGFAM